MVGNRCWEVWKLFLEGSEGVVDNLKNWGGVLGNAGLLRDPLECLAEEISKRNVKSPT